MTETNFGSDKLFCSDKDFNSTRGKNVASDTFEEGKTTKGHQKGPKVGTYPWVSRDMFKLLA